MFNMSMPITLDPRVIAASQELSAIGQFLPAIFANPQAPSVDGRAFAEHLVEKAQVSDGNTTRTMLSEYDAAQSLGAPTLARVIRHFLPQVPEPVALSFCVDFCAAYELTDSTEGDDDGNTEGDGASGGASSGASGGTSNAISDGDGGSVNGGGGTALAVASIPVPAVAMA